MLGVSEAIHSSFRHNSFSRIAAMVVLQTTTASLIDRDRRERSGLAFALGAYVFSPSCRLCLGRTKNKPCPLLAGCTSLKMVLMQADMEIMFGFSFFQCCWCISKHSLTVPSHRAGIRPAAWDRCWPERPLTHPAFQIASDRCQGGHGAAVRSLVSQPYTLTFKASDIVK